MRIDFEHRKCYIFIGNRNYKEWIPLKPKKKRVVFAVNQEDADRLAHLSHFLGTHLEEAPDLSTTVRHILSLLEFYLSQEEFYLDDEDHPVVLSTGATSSMLPDNKKLQFNIAPDDDIQLQQLVFKLGHRLGQPINLTRLLRHAIVFFGFYSSSVQNGHKFYCRDEDGELRPVKASWEKG